MIQHLDIINCSILILLLVLLLFRIFDILVFLLFEDELSPANETIHVVCILLGCLFDQPWQFLLVLVLYRLHKRVLKHHLLIEVNGRCPGRFQCHRWGFTVRSCCSLCLSHGSICLHLRIVLLLIHAVVKVVVLVFLEFDHLLGHVLNRVLHPNLVHLEVCSVLLEGLVFAADVVLDQVRAQLLIVHYSPIHLEIFLGELATCDLLVMNYGCLFC